MGVVVEGDGVDEEIQEHGLLGFQRDGPGADGFQETGDHFLGEGEDGAGFGGELGGEGFLLGFQLGNAGDDDIRGGSGGFQSLQEVAEFYVRVFELLPEDGDLGGFLHLFFGLPGGDGGNVVDDLICQDVQRVMGHNILNPVLGDWFFIARMRAAAGGAGIIIVGTARLASAALADHGGTAMAAEDLSGQKVGDLGFPAGGGLGVGLQAGLYGGPEVIVNQSRDGILGLDAVIFINADILLVPEDVLKAGLIKRGSPGGAKTPGIETLADGGHGFPGGVAGESLHHQRGCGGVCRQALVGDGIAKRDGAPGGLALPGGFRHAALDLLGQLQGIILGHTLQKAFQNHAFRVFGNALLGGFHVASVFSETHPGDGAVLPVPGEAVQLPDQDGLPWGAGTVVEHLLERGAFFHGCMGGNGPIHIDGGDPVTVGPAMGYEVPELALDGLLGLTVGGIAHIEAADDVAVRGEDGGGGVKLFPLLGGEGGEVNGECLHRIHQSM